MPAITSLGISATAPAVRALSALAGRVGQSVRQFADRMRNRRDAFQLAHLDDRMLADIGISRSDLRDAYAGPLWRDPSELLARRAVERRTRRRRPEPAIVSQTQSRTPLFGTPRPICPPADRSGRYLV